MMSPSMSLHIVWYHSILLISLTGLHCCLQELAKKNAKKEEREKRMKHRRSSSKEEWIPRSPSGEAVVGPVPTSMKMKPNPSLGGMAQPRPHGERRVWDGARGLSCVCTDIHMCLRTCQHKKQISSTVEQIGERDLRIHTVLNFGHCEYSDAVT